MHISTFSDCLCLSQSASSETDLGMFSMFGRTGAPIKRGPTRGSANFCLGVMLTTLSLCVLCKSIKSTVMSRKRSSVFEGKKMGGKIAELDDDDH